MHNILLGKENQRLLRIGLIQRKEIETQEVFIKDMKAKS